MSGPGFASLKKLCQTAEAETDFLIVMHQPEHGHRDRVVNNLIKITDTTLSLNN